MPPKNRDLMKEATGQEAQEADENFTKWAKKNAQSGHLVNMSDQAILNATKMQTERQVKQSHEKLDEAFRTGIKVAKEVEKIKKGE